MFRARHLLGIEPLHPTEITTLLAETAAPPAPATAEASAAAPAPAAAADGTALIARIKDLLT